MPLSKDQQLRINILTDIDKERNRQDEMWGRQRHTLGDWLMILGEEFGEVCQAMQKSKSWGKDSDANDLYEELIHLAAVSVEIAEQVREERERHA